MAPVTAQKLIEQLGLEPLAGEGGYYRRVYQDPHTVKTDSLGAFVSSELPLSSAIYYLMTRESFSALHWLAGAEIWTWIAGDPIEQVIAHPSQGVEVRQVGILEGMSPVSVVPGDRWQGARILAGGTEGFSLCSTVMSPSYDERDFRLADAQVCERFGTYAAYLGEFLSRST